MRPMGERVEMPGGTLRVDSKPGAGARLKARVPLYGWKVWWTGLRHSAYVVSECNGFASEPVRYGSPLRGARRRT
jgi:hypothetical protein